MTFRVLSSLFFLSSSANARSPPNPPSTGAVESGVYRNMFVEAGYDDADIDVKINAAFQQLYFGNVQEQRIYFEVPEENSAYVMDVKNADVRTEGMGYGMMIMLQMSNQTGFDMIWRWVKLHMYHTDTSDKLFGWSAWHADPNGTRLGQGPAPDGETWFITSLYFAAARWGKSSIDGSNYRHDADDILAAVNSKSPDSQNMFTNAGTTGSIVRFDPGTVFTDPSYFLPAFYVTWSLATSFEPQRWNDSASSTRNVLYASVNKSTGLGPHSCGYDGGLPTNCGGYGNCLSVLSEDDAWRIPRNWALDYAWWAADPRQIELSNAVLEFFSKNDHYSVFSTSGEQQCGNSEPPCRGLSPGRLSINAVAALASNSSLAWDFIDAIWQEPIPAGDNRDSDRYFSGSLYLEALLHLSGRYRAWLPQSSSILV